jgi:hypothetical protein
MSNRRKRQSKEYLSFGPPVSPLAPIEYRSLIAKVFGVFGLFGIIRSGICPGRDDPKAWYDRAIRVVGGSLILLVFGGVLIAVIVEKISPR